MGVRNIAALGLVLRPGPYRQRSARSQLDVALAAAALNTPLHLYFLGGAVLQLLGERNLLAARYPAGYRGWASLPELTKVCASAEPAWLDHLNGLGFSFLLDLQARTLARMRADWQSCARVLVL